jgi:hypothetical protein
MPELLIRHTSIKLFGRVIQDLKYSYVDPSTLMAASKNNFLANQMVDNTGKNATAAQFARIYAFSYQGHLYTLPKPAVFLVHGDGQPLYTTGDGAGAKGSYTHATRTTLDESGVIAREWEFASQVKGGEELYYWEYEKGDFSVRLDIDSGPFDQILLAASVSTSTALTSGEDLRLSGDSRSRR